jgi:hypothetical protein
MWYLEPANGGIFMVTPKADSLARVLALIQAKEERGAALPFPHWDPVVGWGHTIQPDRSEDCIENISLGACVREWKFHGDFADQGLLYQCNVGASKRMLCHWDLCEKKPEKTREPLPASLKRIQEDANLP